jgi:hypothetical protein
MLLVEVVMSIALTFICVNCQVIRVIQVTLGDKYFCMDNNLARARRYLAKEEQRW